MVIAVYFFAVIGFLKCFERFIDYIVDRFNR